MARRFVIYNMHGATVYDDAYSSLTDVIATFVHLSDPANNSGPYRLVDEQTGAVLRVDLGATFGAETYSERITQLNADRWKALDEYSRRR